MLALKDYQVTEQIYESSNSIVYRGVRRADKLAVILKLLQGEYPVIQQLTDYRQEYDLTRSLEQAGAVEAYELLPYRNSLIMVLEDFGGQSLKSLELAGRLNLETFLTIAIQLSRLVGQVHQAQIIHKDINPTNVIYNPTTRVMKLIDFGISTRLSREYTSFCNPTSLEGTFAYISPEQTGRMNRAIDYRTDLYSLGVMLYELLTGSLPFEATDAMGLVHAHIARQPVSALDQLRIRNALLRNKAYSILVPSYTLLSDIIMKLLAKNAEDRYQSAFGLTYDLEYLQTSLTSFQNLSGFLLGQRDYSGHFQISQKLYGREAEIETLLSAFERVAPDLGDIFSADGREATSELLLVAGYSGVGKSALVHEIHKPITEKQGYFVSGKYDQYQRNVPYYALSQALNEFCNHLLTETPERLAAWKTKILASVGNNGQVLLEVIPNLIWVIGEQPPVFKVGLRESQNRFNFIFQNFVKVICQSEHPLVMFIDDLQWADVASLELLKQMLTDKESHYLLIIGAYRDNEVEATHPFRLMVDELENAGVVVQSIRLPNLMLADVTDLVAETLQGEADSVRELVDLLYEKTQGNAFFIIQFLTLLHEQGHIWFEYPVIMTSSQAVVGPTWHWDMAAIKLLNISDNVVDLIASKLIQLDETTQTALKLAACIGSKFSLSILAAISDPISYEALAAAMWLAVDEGLVISLDESYQQVVADTPNGAQRVVSVVDSRFKFLHDRICQAAYSLIAESERPQLHLNIGRLWLANTVATRQNLEPILFNIVNNLNAGQAFIHDEAEKLQLAHLNLQAGQKAKTNIAYEMGLSFITTAISLLPEDSWTSHYQLTFHLVTEQGEGQFLMGQLAAAEVTFQLALEHAQTDMEKGYIFSALVWLYTQQMDFKRWLEASSQGLQVLGLEIPLSGEAVPDAIAPALAEIETYLADKEMASILELPDLTDEAKLKALDLCINMIPILFVTGNFNLYMLLGLRMVTLSLALGNSVFASHAYIIYGSILVMEFGDYQQGYKWGRLGLQLAEKYPFSAIHVRNTFVFTLYINHWRQPYKTSVDYALQAYTQGVEVGDFSYAGYASTSYVSLLFLMGAKLEFVEQEVTKYFTFAQKTKNQLTISAFFAHIYQILVLTGQSHFQDTSLTEQSLVERIRLSNTQQLIRYLIYKLKVEYLHGHYDVAHLAAQESASFMSMMVGTILFIEFHFYYALTLVALWPSLTENEQTSTLDAILVHQTLIKTWRENCPANFESMELLVAAEVARLQGHGMESLQLYDQAISSSKAHQFLPLQALANELAAKFWLDLNKLSFADLYLREAHYAYQQWGATVKVEQLEAQYLELRDQNRSHFLGQVKIISTASPQNSGNAGNQALDLASVMKASHAISGEIKLARLLEKMMQIVVENAGAERGLLVLRQDNQWLLQAELELGAEETTLTSDFDVVAQVLQGVAIEAINGQSDNPKVSEIILRYVERTQKPLVLDDARQDTQFAQTNYVQKRQPKSVLCVPMINQGSVMGFIYLENNLSTHAFTPERVKVVQLLGTQATISLHNVQTVALQAEQERLQMENEMLGKLNADKDKFFSIVAHDLKGPFMPVLGNAELLAEFGDTFEPQLVKEMGASIQRSARNAFGLLESLLTWARLQMGRLDYQPQRVDLQKVAEQTVQVLGEVAQAKGIRLLNEVAPETWGYGDSNMLDTVIRNLVNNALKFTSSGGQVTIRSAELGVMSDELKNTPNSSLITHNYVEVSITDTGVGMPPEIKEKLFKIDQHVTTVGTGKETGTGLGLIICQEMVIKSGGRIWVESEVGQGTTVHFTVQMDKTDGVG